MLQRPSPHGEPDEHNAAAYRNYLLVDKYAQRRSTVARSRSLRSKLAQRSRQWSIDAALPRKFDAVAEGHQGQSRTMIACKKKMQHVLQKRRLSGFRATLSQTKHKNALICRGWSDAQTIESRSQVNKFVSLTIDFGCAFHLHLIGPCKHGCIRPRSALISNAAILKGMFTVSKGAGMTRCDEEFEG